jgi:flagellar protein FlaJ
MYFERRFRVAVWAVSGCVGILVMLVPVLSGLYVPESPYMVPLNQRVNNTIVLGLLIVFAFPSLVEYNNYRWGKQVDRNVPRLLRDASEAVRSGVTLPRALEEASQRNYGPLSKELERAIAMFVLGESWENSFMSLAHRVQRHGVLRLCTILVEANEAGGRIAEILDASVDLFSSLDQFREEEYTNMKPYMLTIYMATGIFLVIAYVVLHQFLVPLNAASAGVVVKEGGMLASVLDIRYYASILFWASVIESLFGGLIAGKIGDRSLSAGLRHSVILMVLTLVFFNFGGV